MLFVGAKVSQYALLPQGQVESLKEFRIWLNKQLRRFGNCTNTGACEVECPKEMSLENIARMNREFLGSSFTNKNNIFLLYLFKPLI